MKRFVKQKTDGIVPSRVICLELDNIMLFRVRYVYVISRDFFLNPCRTSNHYSHTKSKKQLLNTTKLIQFNGLGNCKNSKC